MHPSPATDLKAFVPAKDLAHSTMPAERVRRIAALGAVLLATACGSDPASVTPPPAPPPPPTAGVPTSITIASGDGQTAAAGATLPVQLSVTVRDANGTAVAAAVVQFTVDSGGGALSVGTVSTGSDGVAGGVTWTLGSAGPNVVAVRVGTLAPLRFHATASGAAARPIITSQGVGPGGGTITFTQAGDALSGLSIVVPSGAYPSGTTWSVTADPSIAVSLPAGFSLAGPPLVIGNGLGYADSVMTLTVPLPIDATIAAAPFYYDPASGLLEPIALVDRTANTATLGTHHFSAELLALPGANGVSALRVGGHGAFGNVVIVWVQTPLAQLVGTYSSNFQPGVDDWEFENWGDFISPGGDCEGMSITAMYYWYTFRRGPHPNSGLYHRYDVSVMNMIDNDQGIRFAGSVQGDYQAVLHLGFDQERRLNEAAATRGANLQLLTSSWIALTIKLTRQPVLLGIWSASGGHAVVGYAVTVTPGGLTTVSISDPNQPGKTGVTMNFVNGLLTPTSLRLNAGTVASEYNKATAVGVSGEVPILAIALRWVQFTQKQAGADRYPTGFSLEYQNQASRLWHTVTGQKVELYGDTLAMRTHCPSCVTAVDNPVKIWNYYVSSLTLGPVDNGPLVGSAVDSPNIPEDEFNFWHGGSINAMMHVDPVSHLKLLTGTATWNVQYSTGIGVYSFTFEAYRVRP